MPEARPKLFAILLTCNTCPAHHFVNLQSITFLQSPNLQHLTCSYACALPGGSEQAEGGLGELRREPEGRLSQ